MGNIARLILLCAVFGVVRANDGFAQNTLTSVIASADTTLRKSSPVAAVKAKSSGFVKHQLEHKRVFDARAEKRFDVKKLFRERGIAFPAAEIFLRGFKRDHTLELWVRPEGQDTFVLLKTYDICALGEKPGPKRKQGDLQTPEGFYHINNFNPQSDYHLSLGVNYPNESDRILHDAGTPLGGDIFIHGGCKTAGCMALTDENIKEVYVIAMEARDRGQERIPAHIFPARLTDDGLKQLVRVFEKEPELVSFWANLKTGYDFFENNKKLPVITVNKRGRYLFKSADAGSLLGTPTAADLKVSAQQLVP
ncbi:MAG: L,D-transpeptidase family protein [Gemmatimonadota bacterium]